MHRPIFEHPVGRFYLVIVLGVLVTFGTAVWVFRNVDPSAAKWPAGAGLVIFGLLALAITCPHCGESIGARTVKLGPLRVPKLMTWPSWQRCIHCQRPFVSPDDGHPPTAAAG